MRFFLSGQKFYPQSVSFDCKTKTAGKPIPIGMTELTTNDHNNKKQMYDCSMSVFNEESYTHRNRENYMKSFSISGPHGGPMNGRFDGPSGSGKRGSLFHQCDSLDTTTDMKTHTMIQQYSGSAGDDLKSPVDVRMCKFKGYFNV